MGSHKSTIRLASACSITNKIWDLAPPLLIGLAVDVVVLKEESFLASYGLVDPWHQLIFLSVLTFAIWGLESLFEYFYGILWRNLAQTVQHELRLDTFNHVQKQGMGWFDERQKGDIVAILNDDINQLERFLIKVPMICCRLVLLFSLLVVCSCLFHGKLPCLPYCQYQSSFGGRSNIKEALSQGMQK